MTYPPELIPLIDEASQRFYRRLESLPPYLARRARTWVDAFTKGHSLAEAVQSPVSFPMVLVVWYLEEALVRPDKRFQADLAYSCITLYLFIRLLDDVMDGDGVPDPKLLPLGGVLHQEFQSSLAAHFAADDPFWNHFRRVWDESAYVTVFDADAEDLTEKDFLEVAGRKCLAIGVQLAAVCCRYDRPDVLDSWQTFLEALSVWHQFGHDAFDWKKDLEHQTTTFFLSEARRRRRQDESVDGWVFREGFAWSRDYLARLTQRLRDLAAPLGSPGLSLYLDEREAMHEERFDQLGKGLELARTLFGLPRS